MGIVFIFQLEHHFAGSVTGTFRQSVYTYGHLRLAFAAHWRQFTPVGLALHFPFAFSIQHQCLRMSVVQCAYRRRTAYQFMMGGNALEVAPSRCRLILSYGTFGHFKREVILGNTFKSRAFNIGRHFSLTYNRTYAVALFKGSISHTFYTFWKDNSFQRTTISKSLFANARHILRNFECSHQAPVSVKGIFAYISQ